MINQYFFISDSFYKMEYKTPQYSIYDFYEIASWNIEVIKKYDQITIVELLVYFNELIKVCPWLYVKKAGIRTEVNLGIFDSKQSYIDFNINMFKKNYVNESIEWDLGIFECGFYLLHEKRLIDMSHKDQIHIYPSFDVDYKTLSFSLDFKMDVFFPNPSRQPNVILPIEYVKLNRDRLSASLKAIDTSGVFIIKNFESEFYPDDIQKYGFKEDIFTSH